MDDDDIDERCMYPSDDYQCHCITCMQEVYGMKDESTSTATLTEADENKKNEIEPDQSSDDKQNKEPVEGKEDGYTVRFTIKEIEEIDLVDRQEVKRRKTSDIRLMKKKKQKKETIITLGFGGIKITL